MADEASKKNESTSVDQKVSSSIQEEKIKTKTMGKRKTATKLEVGETIRRVEDNYRKLTEQELSDSSSEEAEVVYVKRKKPTKKVIRPIVIKAPKHKKKKHHDSSSEESSSSSSEDEKAKKHKKKLAKKAEKSADNFKDSDYASRIRRNILQ